MISCLGLFKRGCELTRYLIGIETRAGDRLLNRTEMRMATEVVDTLLYSKRSTPSEPAKQSGLLQGEGTSTLGFCHMADSKRTSSRYGRVSVHDRTRQGGGLQTSATLGAPATTSRHSICWSESARFPVSGTA